MKILSKVLVVSFLLFSTLFFLFPATSTYAASQATSTRSNTAIPPSNTNPDVPNNLHNWTQRVMIEVMSALSCQLAGVDPINPKQSCLGTDAKTGKIGFLPSPQAGGAIGFMGTMISTLYTPPLQTSDYFQNLASNFGISKHALAATNTGGTGFQSLSPLMKTWTAFRNIVYLVLVIAFVVIGLAIMFRVKIDPRTVMTIQNQIPKIIVGILAVTFSFAIAGLLIDIMWVLIYLIYGVISGISPEIAKNVAGLSPSVLQNTSVLGGAMGIGDINHIASSVASSGSNIIRTMLDIKLENHLQNIVSPLGVLTDLGHIVSGNLLGLTPDMNIMSFIVNLVSTIAGLLTTLRITHIPPTTAVGTTVPVTGGITSLPVAIMTGIGISSAVGAFIREALPLIIIYLIIFIAILTALFRLWFVLLMAYIQILLDVVLAPFWIIGGIIPGSQISLGGWIKDISANLLAFPVTIAMFMLGKVFMDSFGATQTQGQFVPPLIGNPGSTNAIGSLIGLGIILMTPNIVNMLKQMLKAPKMDMGGVSKSIGAGAGVLTGTTKSMVGAGAAYTMGDPLTGKSGAQGLRSVLQRKFFG
jgi:hypothetical protein